jgi:uncharacterized protein
MVLLWPTNSFVIRTKSNENAGTATGKNGVEGALTNMYNRMYTEPARYTWDEKKRQRTLAARGLDFADAPLVFDGVIFTFEDDRQDYGEQRWVTLGMLRGRVVVVVHTESELEIRIISMREANKSEQAVYFRNLS